MADGGKIPFDYIGAKKAGYSDAEIGSYLKQTYDFGFDITGAKNSGYSDKDIADYILKYEAPKKAATVPTVEPHKQEDIWDKLNKEAAAQQPTQEQIDKSVGKKPTVDMNELQSDPFKAILNPVRQDVIKQSKDYLTAKNQPVSESTSQKKLSAKNIVEKNKIDYDVNEISTNPAGIIGNTEQMVADQLFPNGKKANDYVDKIVKEKGDQPDNETFQVAKGKAQIYNNIKTRLKDESIENLAVDMYRQNNQNFDKQIAQINKEGHTSTGSNDLIPNEKKGAIVARWLDANKGDLDEIMKGDVDIPQGYIGTKEDFMQGVKDEYSALKDNIRKLYPEYGSTLIANEISRERTKRGLNNPVVNFDTKTFHDNADKIASEIYKNDPVSQQVYNENRDKILEKIDVPGIVNRFYGGIEKGMTGTRNTINAMTDTPGMNIYEHLQKQYGHVSAGETGILKTLGQAADLAGFVTYMAAQGKIGIPSRVSIGTTFLGDALKEGDARYAGNRNKAIASAFANTAAFMVLPDAVPVGKINEAMSGIKKEITNSISKLGEAEVTPAAIKDAAANGLKKGLEYAGQFAKQHVKTVADLTALTMFNQGVDKALGLDEQTYKEIHPSGEVADQLKLNSIINIPLSAIGGYGEYAKRNFVKESVYDVASNPKKSLSQVNMRAEISPGIRQDLIDKINLLSDTKQLLDENGVSEAKQKTYLLHTANERNLENQVAGLDERIAATKEPVLKSKIEEQKKELEKHIEESRKIKDKILSGKEVKEEDTLPQDEHTFTDADKAQPKEKESLISVIKPEENKVAESVPLSHVPKPEEVSVEGNKVYRAMSESELGNANKTGEIKTNSSMSLPIEKHFGLTGFGATPEETMMYANLNLQRGGKSYIAEIEPSPDMRSDYVEASELVEKKKELQDELNGVEKTLKEKGEDWENKKQFEKWAADNKAEIDKIESQLKELNLPEEQLATAPKGIKLPYKMTPKAVSTKRITRLWEVMPDGTKVEVDPITKEPKSQTPNIKQQGGQNAIPERSPEKISLAETPGSSEEVGARIPESKEPPGTQAGEEKRESEGKEEGFPKITSKSPLIHVEYPPTSINYMGTGRLETELGVEERQPTERKRDIYTIKEADDLLSKGWDAQKELNKLDSGEKTFIGDAEYINFTRYAAELADRLRSLKSTKSPEYDKTLRELSRVTNAANTAGKETGRALGIRGRFSTVAEGSYGEFMLNELAANKDAPLTDKQKETANAEFEKLDVARKKLEEDTKAFEEKVAGFRAEQEMGKTKKQVGKKRGHDELVKERKDLLKNIGEKWKNAGKGTLSSDIPYRQQLAAIAPDVLKLAKNLVEDGILKLEEVVKNIHTQLKDDTDIKEKDIHDILAGEYNEKRGTRKESAIQMENLRIEAQLLNKYERLLKGEEPKKENEKRKRNQEIEDLRNKIKDFRKEESEANKFAPEEKDADIKKLESLQRRNEAETKRIKEKIAKGDFEPDVKKTPLMEDKAIREKFPEQFKATQKSLDEYIKAKREIALRRLKQMYENKTPEEKTIEVFSKSLNVPRTLMASFDFSAPFRQGIIATSAHPQIASKALRFMFEAAKDEKVYNRWIEEVHNSPRWEIAEKTDLGITDPESLHVKKAEEAFQGAPYAEKIPIIGLGVKASERAYIGFLNKLRWDLFNMYADRFEEQGKTYENNPKLYEGISSFINSETGRGGMKGLEGAAPVLNWFLFASKLIASRLNMLGLSDIPNLAVRGATFGKYGLDYGFYSRLPKELRVEAAKDMLKFLAVGMSTLAIASQLGADTDKDPRSSDFGKIKVGNTRWDIWGGFQPYARVLSQVVSGQRKTTTTGEIQDLENSKFMGQNRFTPLVNFARGKLAPIPASAIDLISHRDAAGQPVTVKSELTSLVTPLLFQDTYTAMQDQGVKALFTVGLPAAFGIGVQTYKPKPQTSKPKKPTKSKPKKQEKK